MVGEMELVWSNFFSKGRGLLGARRVDLNGLPRPEACLVYI